MQGNEIGMREQFIEIFYQLHLQAARARRGKIWIVGNDPHSERDRPAAELASDSAHADDAKCLVVELYALELFPIPFLRAQTRIGLRNFSRNAKQKRKCVLCRGNGVSAR